MHNFKIGFNFVKQCKNKAIFCPYLIIYDKNDIIIKNIDFYVNNTVLDTQKLDQK